MTTRRGRPTRTEAQELDRRVREAAVEAFLESGYAATSMDAIARAAGITRKTLYARYPDKRTAFLDVIPWALSGIADDDSFTMTDTDDLEADLIAFGRLAIARATHPRNVKLKRIAMTEAAQFPEFAVAADSMTWAPRQRVLADLLRRHAARGRIEVDDAELTAEHFLTLVESVPARLADFGIFRTEAQQDRHLRSAIRLFLLGTTPR
ncbi:TetR/AcrR family transcriptional regulator [[Mycobacterium] fortunisiensis]|uniref:TetR/AcrR family transcriptional regulator n=1 Tax=[Mycobacterium] fortunisiensis TaxID=2600579 RepID=UPI0027E0E805|nr:TetR/AcrR family transcriptional regulator [[Mycobacterium] fortunisiensis]